MGDLYEQQGNADSNSPVAANIKQVEDRLDELERSIGAPEVRTCAGAALHDQ